MDRQVFHDPTGRRGRVVGVVGGAFLLLVLISSALVVQGALVAPSLPETPLATAHDAPPAEAPPPADAHILPALFAEAQPLAAAAADVPRLAFLNPFDPASQAAFRRQRGNLDGVLLGGLTLSERDEQLQFDLDEDAAEFLKDHRAELRDLQLFLVADIDGRPERLSALLASDDRRARLERFAEILGQGEVEGVVIDLSGADDTSHGAIASGLRALRAALAARGKLLLAHPPSYWSAPALGALARSTDYTLISLFDHVSPGAAPRPLSGHEMTVDRLKMATHWIGAERLIPVVGSFAALWSGPRYGDEVSVQHAWDLIGDRLDRIQVSQRTLTSVFRDEQAGAAQEIHLLDGVAAFNQARAALSRQPAALAIWRLGQEDPSLWGAIGRGKLPNEAGAEALRVVEAGDDAVRRTPSSLFSATPGRSGEREIAFNPRSGLLHDQRWLSLPKQYSFVGHAPAADSNMLALTFDDGPDPLYTPQILDILREHDVKATFYVIGQAAAAHPEIMRRIYAEGHDVGNHSHSHPQLWRLSKFEIGVELNRVQRILESTIGVNTRLMRPPYIGPDRRQFIYSPDLMSRIGELGYLVGGVDASSHDWLSQMGGEQIVETLVGQVAFGKRPSILLHDGGGDRSDTVAALPELIRRLRADGYNLVTTHEAYGLSRDEAMPSVGAVGSFERAAAQLRGGAFAFGQSFETSIPFFALIVTGFGVIRLLAILGGAALHRRRQRRAAAAAPHTARSVAVLIPAYNEEKVIAKTIESVLASKGAPNLQILVVDDGSKDGTWRVLQERYGDHPKVRPMTKPNGGKAAAVNYALARAEAEIVVCIDADTVLGEDAIARLATYFENPEIGAVAGTVEVGNADNWITRMQALEYITCQNLDRRAFALGNAVSVVPGAIGAWRRSALVAVGGFPQNTLAEDADATLRVLFDGWRIESDAEARAYTEAPQTVRELMKQRRRWSFGTLQVAAKTLGELRRRFRWRLAAFYLPNIAFLLAFTLLAPMVDALLVYGAVLSLGRLAQGGSVEFGADILLILLFWAVFQLVDFAVAAVGLSFEKDRRWLRLLPWVPLQRFGYRQVLYVVTIGALLSALKGQFVGWGKLLRTGAVRASAGMGSAAAPIGSGGQATTDGEAR